MKSYNEFVEHVRDEIRDLLPEEYRGVEIETRRIDKLQDAGYYGLFVKPEDSNIGVSLDLTGEYKKLNDGFTYPAVMYSIADLILQSLESRSEIDTLELSNYEQMKTKLMIQVIPTEKNAEILADIPHRNVEDLSLVYRFVLNAGKNGQASALATNGMLENFGISPEQLHADAMENAPKAFPPSIKTMQEVMAQMLEIEPEELPAVNIDMYMMTCNGGLNGAGCIFYPGILDEAAEVMAGSFYILPSSVHEVLLIPDKSDTGSEELEAMVRQINEAEVAPEDRLSDTVYHYDARERKFERAKAYEERAAAAVKNAPEREEGGR